MPVSDTTILRSVKECVGAQPTRGVVRVAGIDEWAWRKGMTFGTVIVDLERRQVVELLADRSAGTAAHWFKKHPEIEVVSRDRAGLYADAARQGAPQARQVADRFHLLKNFQETVERQLGRFEAPIRASAVQFEGDLDTLEQPAIERSNGCSDTVAHERLLRRGRAAARKAMFDDIRALYEAGSPVTEIARKLGLGPRRVYRWVRRIDLPEPSAMEPKVCTPAYFGVPGAPLGRGIDQSPASGSRISVIEATPARLATWRASSLRGAAAALPQEKRVKGLRWTRKPRRRHTCEAWTR